MTARLLRLFALIPALLLALMYGRATGDVGSSQAVIALLLGMGIGTQLAHRPRSES